MARRRTDDDDLGTWRIAALVVFLVIDLFLVAADVLGRLFKDGAFHVEAVVFGLAFGTTLTLLGIQGLTWLFEREK